MYFKEVVVELIQRNTAVISNALYGIRTDLKEINKTLQVIGGQLKELNEQMGKEEKAL